MASASACSPAILILACLSAAYMLACAVYLIAVQAMQLGTPFMSSLTEEQLALYKASKEQRRRIFYGGFAGALVVCGVVVCCWLCWI